MNATEDRITRSIDKTCQNICEIEKLKDALFVRNTEIVIDKITRSFKRKYESYKNKKQDCNLLP